MTKKGFEKELMLLAKVRWDIRREKDDYKQDFQEYIRTHPEQQDNPLIFENFKFSQDETLKKFKERVEQKATIKKIRDQMVPDFNFTRKWGFFPPVDSRVEHPNPYSLQSLMYVKRPVSILGHYRFPLQRKYHRDKKIFDFVKSSSKDQVDFKRYKTRTYNIVGNCIKTDPPDHNYNLESKKIILEIDLDQKKKYIQQEFSEIVNHYQNELVKRGLKTDRKDDLKVAADSMKVYRLKNEGKGWEDIAKEIFPEDFGDITTLKADKTQRNPESAKVKVHQYYSKAKELIKEGL
jgi:hypothetical protein